MQSFGGPWTNEKLKRLRNYLQEYARIMRKQRFRFAYIDAFAGTGYIQPKRSDSSVAKLFPELGEDMKQYFHGSARIALEMDPPFEHYIFIDRSRQHANELERLRMEYPQKQSAIEIVHAECNEYLQSLCKRNWKRHRAVVFLDPFGMNVAWKTIEALANTAAVDLWYLFPIGVGVNRLLTRDGKVPESWSRLLDSVFGDTGWRERFYAPEPQMDLFTESTDRKTATYDAIKHYLMERLDELFPGVARNPLYLYNNKGIPIYLFCFACANETGAPIATRITEHILKP